MNRSREWFQACCWREVRFVLVWGVIALTITSIPYLFGAALATGDDVFTGFVFATEDMYSYLAKMRQGAEGAWLFHTPYTPEPHRGTFFFPFHLILGKGAALYPVGDLTVRLIWTYHLARTVLGLGLLLTVYRFLAVMTGQRAIRRLAWLMVTFGGGLGWVLVVLGQPKWLDSLPLDFILPEGFTFLTVYGFPHIALGCTFLLWGVVWLLRAWRTGNAGWATVSGVGWLAAGLIVPFYVGVAWAVAGAAWVTLGLREHRFPWREGWLAGWAALVSAPVVAYSGWVFATFEVYDVWAAQNTITSPHPFHYLMAYGPLLVLAAFAMPHAWRARRPAWVTLAWVAVVPVLVYLPFNLQRRLVAGVQVPLSLLAAIGLAAIKGFRSKSWLAVGSVVVFLSLTNVLLVTGACVTLQDRPELIYRDVGEIAAMDWLSGRAGSEDVVLAAYETGNYLPARVGARVFVGHGPESVRADHKRALVAQFFDGDGGDAWRGRLLTEYGVDYVFWGPAERALGSFDPWDVDYLMARYVSPDYVIFEVVE